jgi:hypothetical protein
MRKNELAANNGKKESELVWESERVRECERKKVISWKECEKQKKTGKCEATIIILK